MIAGGGVRYPLPAAGLGCGACLRGPLLRRLNHVDADHWTFEIPVTANQWLELKYSAHARIDTTYLTAPYFLPSLAQIFFTA